MYGDSRRRTYLENELSLLPGENVRLGECEEEAVAALMPIMDTTVIGREPPSSLDEAHYGTLQILICIS